MEGAMGIIYKFLTFQIRKVRPRKVKWLFKVFQNQILSQRNVQLEKKQGKNEWEAEQK